MKTIYFLIGLISLTLSTYCQDAVFYKLPNGIAPAIDGTIDALWTGVEVHNINKALNGYPATTPNTSTWQAVWNDTAIFVLVNVRDNNHCDEWCSGQPSWISDRLEIYFDVNDTLIDGLGASAHKGHFQFAPSWQRGINQYSTYYTDWQGYNYYYGYKITGENFVYEYSIPFSTLRNKNGIALNPNTIDNIGFDVCFNDLDSVGTSEKMSMWKNDKVSSWGNMDDCGVVSFNNNSQQKIQVVSTIGNLSNGSSCNIGFATPNATKEVSFTLKNMGLQDLTISSITITGTGYSVIPPADLTLSPFETQMVKIDFLRIPVGVYNGTLTIISNDPVNGTTNINLVIGNGLTMVYGGNVTGSWTKNYSPYQIYGNIIIPDDSLLTIGSGVTVRFMGHYFMDVQGSLKATGAKSDSIIFTRTDTSGLYKNDTTKSWAGIKMFNSWQNNYPMSNNDSSVLSFCVFKHSKTASPDTWLEGGAIRIDGFDKVRIENCHFIHNYSGSNGGALHINNSNILVKGCLFDHNYAHNAGALNISFVKTAVIESNVFYKNHAIGQGGALYCNESEARVIKNIFTNNSAFEGGSILIATSNDKFYENIIVNNTASNVGGGMVVSSSLPEIYNCLIANNLGGGGGLVFWGPSYTKVINTILYGNRRFGDLCQARLDASTTPVFQNCIIQEGKDSIEVYPFGSPNYGTYVNDTDANPKFIKPSGGAGISFNGMACDWSDSINTPCLNKGDNDIADLLKKYGDFRGNPRVLHAIIDIGPYETHILSKNLPCIISSDLNLICDTAFVNCNVKISDGALLNITPGTKILFNGYYQITVEGRILAEGTSDKPITFSKIDTSGFYNKYDTSSGSWKGIVFDNSFFGAFGKLSDNDSSIFDNCIFQYVKFINSDAKYAQGGGLRIRNFSKLRLSNSILQYNVGWHGGGVCIDNLSSPVITNNKFYKNSAIEQGGAIHVGNYSNPSIFNNIIANNEILNDTLWCRGGGLSVNSSNPSIINNIVANNYCTQGGGGIWIYNAYTVFTNNSVVNNESKVWGGGILVEFSAFDINNTILWGDVSGGSYNDPLVATNSEINIKNCLIEKGDTNIYDFTKSTINIQNLVSESPRFINPSNCIGSGCDGLNANWRLSDFSPAIEKGVPVNLSNISTDIYGNPRINGNTIDIGASENQGKEIEFIVQPEGTSVCEGDTIALSVSLSDSAKIQWQKDGIDISGATDSVLRIYSIRGFQQGNFVCTAKNAYGKIYSNPVFIQVRKNPVITEQPEGGLISLNETYKLDTRAIGEAPLSYQWYKKGTPLAGDTIFRLQLDSFKLKDEGSYYCVVSNVCSSVPSATAVLSMAPQICMVTAKDSTANIVIFEKGSIVNYAKFNVYREGITLGYYEKLNSVSATSPGIFVDNVDPREQAYLYKITGVKANNAETDINLCNTHKTMHLRVSKGVPSGYQLDWDEYIGFPYSTYYIYRSTDGGVSFDSIHAMSSSTRSYTDYSAPAGLLLYYVAVIKTDGCYPNGRTKAGSDIYSQSVSNLEDNRIRSTGILNTEFDNLNFTCYPNPYNDITTISYNLQKTSDVKIEVYNLLGKIVATLVNGKQQAGNNQLRFNPIKYGLSNGIYILKLKAENKINTIRLVGLK